MNCVLIFFWVAKNSPIDWRKIMIGPCDAAVKIGLQENSHIAILFLKEKNEYPSPDCLSHFFHEKSQFDDLFSSFFSFFCWFSGQNL